MAANGIVFVNADRVGPPLRAKIVPYLFNFLHAIYRSVPAEFVAAEAISIENRAYARTLSLGEYFSIIHSYEEVHSNRRPYPIVSQVHRIPILSLSEEAFRRHNMGSRLSGNDGPPVEIVQPNTQRHLQRVVPSFIQQPTFDFGNHPIQRSTQQPSRESFIQRMMAELERPLASQSVPPSTRRSIPLANQQSVQIQPQPVIQGHSQPLMQTLAYRPTQQFVHPQNQQPAYMLQHHQPRTQTRSQPQYQPLVQPVAQQYSQATRQNLSGHMIPSKRPLRTIMPSTSERTQSKTRRIVHTPNVHPLNGGVRNLTVPKVTQKASPGRRGGKPPANRKKKVNSSFASPHQPAPKQITETARHSAIPQGHHQVLPNVAGSQLQSEHAVTGVQQQMSGTDSLNATLLMAQERVKQIAMRGRAMPASQVIERPSRESSAQLVSQPIGMENAQSRVRPNSNFATSSAQHLMHPRPFIQKGSSKKAKVAASRTKIVREHVQSEITKRFQETAEAAVQERLDSAGRKANQVQKSTAPQMNHPSAALLTQPIGSQVQIPNSALGAQESVGIDTRVIQNNVPPAAQTNAMRNVGLQNIAIPESDIGARRAAQESASAVERQTVEQTIDNDQEVVMEKTTEFFDPDFEAFHSACHPSDFDWFNSDQNLM